MKFFCVEANNTRLNCVFKNFKTVLKMEKHVLLSNEYKSKMFREVLIQIVSNYEKIVFFDKKKKI